MKTTRKNYDVKNYKDVLKFVKKIYDYKYDEEEQEVIAKTIYVLANSVIDTNYSFDNIEDYDGLDFDVEMISNFRHYVVRIDNNEEYRVFFGDWVRDEYAKELAKEEVRNILKEVEEYFPNVVSYIDTKSMVEDFLIDADALIGTFDGTCSEIEIDGELVCVYRI
jgi:hypothetical protein